jgi:hypothetical protein
MQSCEVSFGLKAESALRAYLTGEAKFKGNHKKLYPCLRVFLIYFFLNFLLRIVLPRLTVHI